MTNDEAIATIESKFSFGKKVEFRGETTLTVERASIHEAAKICKDELAFDYLVDLSGVDNFGAEPRFEVVYELYSMARGQHLRLKISVSEDALEVPTVSDLWATADWHEREAFDMFGLVFTGHPDVRRILRWEGYPYYPLRKDFPLAGKASDSPDIAFSKAAPLEGGPFVTVPAQAGSREREPRARRVD